ncbi:MAG: ankyrin repeat domain-containing protein [Pseudobdellovibrionaceae bacterium]|nr:ankyrin repeat domain-containing protein [Pseudobdellovibrionaceae bacterium]
MMLDDVFQSIRLHQNKEVRESLGSFDIKQTNESGQTVLHEAVAFRNEDIVGDLIQRGVDVNWPDKNGQTALHFSAAHKLAGVAATLLKQGGSLQIADRYGNQPLWTAVMNAKGQYDVVKLFVKHGADIHHKNKAGRAPLDFAKQINESALIGLLIGASS